MEFGLQRRSRRLCSTKEHRTSKELGPRRKQRFWSATGTKADRISAALRKSARLSTRGSTINNLAITSENLSSAESRIRDVDVAYETAQLTRNSILQQASISVLSQANALPQSAMRLLG